MLRIFLALLILIPTAAAAADEVQQTQLGEDSYMAGRSVVMDSAGRDDVFLAGERVTLAAGIGGSAHMAGRWVTVEAPVGGDLYAAGQTVEARAAIEGDATLAGQEVDLSAPVTGDVRAFGSEVTVSQSVGGTLLAAGEFVEIDGTVAGDAMVTARELQFGPGASVGGTLHLYEEDPGDLIVPESVAPEAQIQRHEIEEWEHELSDYAPTAVSKGAAVMGFIFGVIGVTVLAAGAAVLAPAAMAGLRARVLSAPWRSLASGFITESALIGGAILIGFTLIGLLLTPAFLLVAGLAWLVGYVIAAYALGVWLTGLVGRAVPQDAKDRALAAAVGALVAALVGLIPFAGWLVVMALTLAGIGALASRWIGPRLAT